MTQQHININAALVEGLTDADRTHMAACTECRQKFEATSNALASLKSVDHALESVPESFWQAQQRAIRIGAAEARPVRSVTAIYALAGATAAALLVALSLLSTNEKITIPPKPQVEMSDAALLESVQDHLEAYPEALHPAQVMYSEMASAKTAASSVPTNKRK